MPYTTSAKVRNLTGLTSDEISADDLNVLRNYAENRVLREITVRTVDEEVSVDPDHDNVINTSNTPLADTDKDEKVNSNDITIYSWSDEDDESTKSEVTVTSVNAESGHITLNSNVDGASKVTADYSFYLGRTPDWNLIEQAVIYLTASIALKRVKGKLPPDYKIGKMHIKEEIPGSVYEREYDKIIRMIKNKMYSKS